MSKQQQAISITDQGFQLENPGAGTICFLSLNTKQKRNGRPSSFLLFQNQAKGTTNIQIPENLQYDAHHGKSCCSYAVKELPRIS